MLQNSGLITQEPDTNDKRRMLILPTGDFLMTEEENNSELGRGVEKEDEDLVVEDIPF